MKLTVSSENRLSGVTLEQTAEPTMSPNISVGMRHLNLSTTYKEEWANALSRLLNIVPKLTQQTYATATNTSLTYYPGHKYGLAGTTNVRAVDGTIEPFGKSSTDATAGIKWTYAHINVNYETMPLSYVDHLIEESWDPIIEFVTMPSRKLYWDASQADPLKNDESPARQVHMSRWSYTIRGLRGLPVDLGQLQGAVNSVAMYSPTYDLTFPVGTVLFKAPHIAPSQSNMGYNLLDITWEFVVREEYSDAGVAQTGTWNKGYKAGTRLGQTIYDDAGAEFAQYASEDIGSLLLVEV